MRTKPMCKKRRGSTVLPLGLAAAVCVPTAVAALRMTESASSRGAPDHDVPESPSAIRTPQAATTAPRRASAGVFTVDPGTIIGEDTDTNTLVKWDTLGNVLDTLPLTGTSVLGTLDGLAVLNGEVWLAGTSDNVGRVDLSSGAVIDVFTTVASGTEALGVINGNLLVGDYSANEMYEYTTAGVLVNTYTLTTGHGMAGADSDDAALYEGSYNEGPIFIYDLVGNETGIVTTGLPAGEQSGLGYDEDTGTYWVATGFGDDRIRNYAPGGSVLADFPTGFGWINGIDYVSIGDPCANCPCPEDIDRDGRVAFSDVLRILAEWGDCPPEVSCPDPGVCGTYVECGFGEPFDCVCWTTFDGEGVCYQDFPCADTMDCPDGNCPPGFVCVVGSCCGVNKCVPMITCDEPAYTYANGTGLTGAGVVIESATDRPGASAVGCGHMGRGIGGGRLLGLSSDDPATLYEIDAATGLATPLTDLDVVTSLVGLSCLEGSIYGSDLLDAGFFTGVIDPATGATTAVSDQDGSANWHGLATEDIRRRLWTIDIDDNFILKSLDPGTGVVTSVGGGTGIDGRGMAFDDGSGILYATHNVNDTLYRVNTISGLPTLIGPIGVNCNVVGLAFDEANRTLYLNSSETNTLYTVNVITGAATAVGPNGGGFQIDGLAWCVVDPCDDCPCPADVNRDGTVSFADILRVLAAWGPCEVCDDCADGRVDTCDDNPDCLDCMTPDGECICVQNASCGDLERCFEGDCPPGFFCCVNTCCEEPVCLPLCDPGATDVPDVQQGGTAAGR